MTRGWLMGLALGGSLVGCECDRQEAVRVTAEPPPSAAPEPSVTSAPPRSDHFEEARALERQGRFDEAMAKLDRACKGDHDVACIRHAGYHVLGLGPRDVNLARASAALEAPCGRGHRRACALRVLVSLAEQSLARTRGAPYAEWSGNAVDRVLGTQVGPEGFAAAEAACEDGRGDACFLLAARDLVTERWLPAHRRARRACEQGSTDACLLMAGVGASTREQARRELVDLARLGCEGGNEEACSALVTETHLEALQHGGPDAELEGELARICAAEPSAHWASTLERVGNPMQAGTCAALALRLEQRQESERARPLRERACRLGQADLCP